MKLRRMEISRGQMISWRRRFAQGGVAAIDADLPRSGRKRQIDAAEIVRLTTQTIPKGATHWSTRTLAAEVGVSDTTIHKVWKAHGLKPHLVETFKVSRDPEFAEKLEDIVGLYLSPPEHALVLCCDEKSQVQALDRTQPGLPLKKGKAADDPRLQAAWHDHFVCGNEHARHRRHLALRATAPPWRVAGLPASNRSGNAEGKGTASNYATHKHPAVRAWLEKHPRFHMHFTPTSASWPHMVERFFRSLSTDRLARGVFKSVPELIAAIDEYIAVHNENPKPFVWTAKANDILQKVIRANRRPGSKKNEALH